MVWAVTSQSKITLALLYPFNRDGLLWVGTAMAAIDKLPPPISQQAIDSIEVLLTQLDAINVQITSMAPKAGRIKLDVIGWSDKPGQIMAGVYKQREWIRSQLSSALGLAIYINPLFGNGNGNTLSRS